jgi:hypothetical protein
MIKYMLIGAFIVSQGARGESQETMRPFELNGLNLSGAEYWPVHGSTEFHYPEDVLWGFYPKAGVIPEGETEPNLASATPEAVACAETAYARLTEFFAAHSATLDRIVEIGASHLVTNKFYLWVNDYSQAADPFPFGRRPEKFWYWTRSPQEAGRTPGYWKWEVTLTQRGECLVPGDAQIELYLRQKLLEIGS